MVNQDFVNRLIVLLKQDLIAMSDIKLQEYSDAVATELKQEVASGIITADQYQQITGIAYVA